MHSDANGSKRKVREGRRFALTQHARERMSHRGIRPRTVDAVLTYGRVIYTRGAYISAIGRKEVRFYAREGIDLTTYEGTQVVVGTDGHVLTVYRNRDFRGLRASRSSRRRVAA